MIDHPLLVHELHTFALMLVSDYPVSDALHDLVDATAAILGVHGAGVSLASDDRLALATASPEDITSLEALQERSQVGPSIDAFRTGTPVLVTDLTTEPADGSAHWPELAGVAATTGIVALAAVPLHLHGAHLGVLDLYDAQPHAWSQDEVETAELLAALATGYLANASRLDQARQTAAQLQVALDSRVVIEQAKGVLAGERGISVDAAFQVLRAYARAHRIPLREVARAVVDGRVRP